MYKMALRPKGPPSLSGTKVPEQEERKSGKNTRNTRQYR